jgi:hypothetical protein
MLTEPLFAEFTPKSQKKFYLHLSNKIINLPKIRAPKTTNKHAKIDAIRLATLKKSLQKNRILYVAQSINPYMIKISTNII